MGPGGAPDLLDGGDPVLDAETREDPGVSNDTWAVVEAAQSK